AFQVTADVPEIYMQEFWATAKLHHNSIRFKMDTKKSVLDLEAFNEMLHISPRIPSQSFAELPFEEEILDFLRFLGHSHEIRYLTDVNVNKLYQPWRSFSLVINKCLTGKSSGIDSFRLSQAQILWGFYHRINVDYAYLIWEDFVYQVEHKNQKRSNKMYYPRFTKVIINYFMTSKPSISRRNKINWHYVRDDVLFSTIKVVSRHQTTQQYGAILPIELTTDEIRNSKAYKEYYACATGDAAPKPKASARKKKGDSASSTTPPTPTPTTTVVSASRLSATAKGSEDKSNDEEDHELRLSEEARIQEEEEADELYRDVNINQGRGLQVTQNIEDSHVTLTPVHPYGPQESSSMSSFVTSMLNPISDARVESIFTTVSSPIVSLQTPTPIMTPSTIATTTTSRDAPIPQTTHPSIILENLPMFNSAFRFDERLRSLETTFSEYRQTNTFVDAVSAIPENDEFLRNIDENMKKIIKGQVKSQVKEQVSRILPRIEESVNATLEAEVLTRSSHSSRTSYAIAADLSEMELKKILIENMEGNKSIQRSDEQQNLYKVLVEAYDADKAILDTYGESTILKRRREDDDPEGPSAGSDRGSKRQKKGDYLSDGGTPTSGV
nr:hypothetical protein [Tanacetum cinerariifolium]